MIRSNVLVAKLAVGVPTAIAILLTSIGGVLQGSEVQGQQGAAGASAPPRGAC
jgi:hypothetical protein